MPVPTLFVSHGSPMVAVEQSAARDFLFGLAGVIPRPEAVLIVSAHWETDEPVVSAAESPATIHDFRGFPEELYRLRYPAPGAPPLARRTAELLSDAGFPCRIDPDRGLDHGAWVPMLLAFPEAEIPVTQLSLQPAAGAAHHLAIGRALRGLRDEGVLILASGAVTHNLGDFGRYPLAAPPVDYARAFTDWLAEALDAGAIEALVDYRTRAPHAARNHPTEEHFLPLFAALGAAGDDAPRVRRLHASYQYGVFAMDAYAFDAAA